MKGSPGHAVTDFAPSDRTVYSVIKLDQRRAGQKIRFSWWIVDADASKDQKIKDIDYTTKTQENIVHGHLNLPRDWPKGKYQVKVYVERQLRKTLDYEVN